MEEASSDLSALDSKLEALEFRRMFSGEMDGNSAFLDIQAGSGGTEAQDWADMLLRMYLRWAESHGFKAELMEVSDGEVAGIKGATIHVEGEHAFGWLRTETGVHRLVRKSPFDSGNRRHTSFASVFVSPELDDDIDIDLDEPSKEELENRLLGKVKKDKKIRNCDQNEYERIKDILNENALYKNAIEAAMACSTGETYSFSNLIMNIHDNVITDIKSQTFLKKYIKIVKFETF